MILENKPLQQIFYGAPGTGKSYAIDKITKVYDTIRTTFHPDSDYSTFVGAYKPTMTKVGLRDMLGNLVKEEGTTRVVKEDRITYRFVKQAFLKAYLAAWKKYSEATNEDVAPQFLVIEEINRGNCAQIFGDLFQLLDHQDNGFSSYPIEADTDLQREIKEAFAENGEYQLSEGGLDLQGAVKDYTSDLSTDITNGKILLLPCNLYIWATMNTSDQSLFPIDSAFKRRWDWKYVKIADAHKNFKIKCGGETCDWWTFVTKINEKIAIETNSDDKKLGYFFCKPTSEDNLISEERFVSKVMFYLWNDVFKDGTTDDFKVSDNANDQVSFDAFYNDDNTINVEKVRKFLINIVGEENLNIIDEDEDESSDKEDSSIAKKLSITFDDGTTIEGSTQFESYLEAIRKIGIEKIYPIAAQLKYKRKGCSLVDKEQQSAILNSDFTYVQEGNYYVVKGVNLSTLVRALNHWAEVLGISIKVMVK